MGSIAEHWFWAAVTAMAVVWYSTITVYVAVRAVSDISRMLGRLKERQRAEA
jgi:hypothetical protein